MRHWRHPSRSEKKWAVTNKGIFIVYYCSCSKKVEMSGRSFCENVRKFLWGGEKAASEFLLINPSEPTSSCHQVYKYKYSNRVSFWNSICGLALCGLFTKRTRGRLWLLSGGDWRDVLTRIGVERQKSGNNMHCQQATLAWNIPNKSIRRWLGGCPLHLNINGHTHNFLSILHIWHSRNSQWRECFGTFHCCPYHLDSVWFGQQKTV